MFQGAFIKARQRKMDEKLYSWFLGPKAENADIFERLVLEALRDCVFWRRNFHPEDEIIITEEIRRDASFQESIDLLQQKFITMDFHPHNLCNMNY
jgi:hypothetical protein